MKNWHGTTASGIARKEHGYGKTGSLPQIADLVDAYEKNRKQATLRLRKELRF